MFFPTQVPDKVIILFISGEYFNCSNSLVLSLFSCSVIKLRQEHCSWKSEILKQLVPQNIRIYWNNAIILLSFSLILTLSESYHTSTSD